MNVTRVIDRVRAEFNEMPGMTLTVPQALKVLGLAEELCRSVVEQLVSAEYLRKTESGAVTRAAQ